jgi:acetyl-CoA carboxylase biotin carboxyl carrier protein
MDVEDVRQLIALLKEYGLTEITVAHAEERVTVRQPPAAGPVRGAVPTRPADAAEEEGDLMVRAPLVGTFYRRRAPDEEPLVEAGDRVDPGDVLGIIEAMKVMNEVTAEHAGIVRGVLAQDGAAVEFGEPLFRLEVL